MDKKAFTTNCPCTDRVESGWPAQLKCIRYRHFNKVLHQFADLLPKNSALSLRTLEVENILDVYLIIIVLCA